MDQAQTEVLETIQTMTAAFGQQNITTVLSSYEPGAAVMFEPGQKISDATILQQMFEGAFQLQPQFQYPKGHEVYIAKDLALHIAPWVMQGRAADGTIIEQSGLSVAVLRRQANGRWLLVLDNPHGQRLITPQH